MTAALCGKMYYLGTDKPVHELYKLAGEYGHTEKDKGYLWVHPNLLEKMSETEIYVLRKCSILVEDRALPKRHIVIEEK